MLLRRALISFRPHIARLKHTGVALPKDDDYDLLSQVSSQGDSILPFNRKRHSESFGQLVRSDARTQSGDVNDEHRKYIRRPEDPAVSDYKDPDGSYIQGKNSEEARLHPLTLQGKADHSVVKLPSAISKTINNNILSARVPNVVRERAQTIYQSLDKDQIQEAPVSALDSDAHIAALFLQDFANVKKVLGELQKRVGVDKFNPKSVLDIGYGPATGMVALNEIMGADFKPEVKDAYIVGRLNNEMKRRAKLILSRQPCEVDDRDTLKIVGKDDYVGHIDTRKLRIRTNVRDSLASSKKYELIIVNQALLTRKHSFPRDVDLNLEMVLAALKPGGHLVLLERGNPLGFEIIARARQVMLRPENFTHESGKIPRPYIRGSKPKPQKLRKEDQMVTEEQVKHEEKMLMKAIEEDGLNVDDVDLEKHLNEKYGELSDEDLRFEFEDELEKVSSLAQSEMPDYAGVDYHLSVVAPCPHHGKCPLQLGDPVLYKVSHHKHRFDFCAFDNVSERPKYTMELKKGKRLATPWEKADKLTKSERKALEGGGRPGSNNTELGTYSYLIMHRSLNDKETIKKIEADREHASESNVGESMATWPRLIGFPAKVKKNVKFNVCAPLGNIETWQVPKSLGKQVYHDARKARQGDLWPLGRKTFQVRNKFSEEGMARLKSLAKAQRKVVLKEKRKKEWKKREARDPALLEEESDSDPYALNELYASQFESTKKYRQQTKKIGFDT